MGLLPLSGCLQGRDEPEMKCTYGPAKAFRSRLVYAQRVQIG